MKKLFYLLLFILFLVPINSFALNKEYKDILYDLTGEEVIENKINIYFFSASAPVSTILQICLVIK